MKKFLLVTLSFFLIIHLKNFSQVHNDVVFLKNGSIVKGSISESSSEKIIIKTINGNTFIFNHDEIKETKHKYNRYICYTSAGILIGSALNEKEAPLSVLTEHNYQFLDYFAAGVTTGVELLNETTIPVGMNCKIYLPLNSGMLYLNGTAGHSYSIDKPDNIYDVIKHTGGALAGIDIGLIIPLNTDAGLFFAAGYRYSELKYSYEDWSRGEVNRNFYYNRLNLKFGLCLY